MERVLWYGTVPSVWFEEDRMSALVASYIEMIANGELPKEDSEEAKEYRAWSWAYEQLRKIKIAVDENV